MSCPTTLPASSERKALWPRRAAQQLTHSPCSYVQFTAARVAARAEQIVLDPGMAWHGMTFGRSA